MEKDNSQKSQSFFCGEFAIWKAITLSIAPVIKMYSSLKNFIIINYNNDYSILFMPIYGVQIICGVCWIKVRNNSEFWRRRGDSNSRGP